MSYASDWVNKKWTATMSIDPYIAAGNEMKFEGDGTLANRATNRVKNKSSSNFLWGDDFFYDSSNDEVREVRHLIGLYRIKRTTGTPNTLTCWLEIAGTTSTCWTANDG